MKNNEADIRPITVCQIFNKMRNRKQIEEMSDRPVWSLTIEEIKQVIREEIYNAITDIMSVKDGTVTLTSTDTKPKYITGLKGIQKEFGVGHNTAQHLKDTVFRDAVLQGGPGCKIIVDRALAHKLYSEYMKTRENKY